MRPRRPKNSKTRKEAVDAGYRSGLELGIARQLKSLGIKFTYEQEKFIYVKAIRKGRCNSCKGRDVGRDATYTPDFRIDGTFTVEAKGRFTASDRAKLKLVKHQHPSLDLRLLLSADNWCTKLRKQRYSDWCKANGFLFHVGTVIPASWIIG